MIDFTIRDVFVRIISSSEIGPGEPPSAGSAENSNDDGE